MALSVVPAAPAGFGGACIIQCVDLRATHPPPAAALEVHSRAGTAGRCRDSSAT